MHRPRRLLKWPFVWCLVLWGRRDGVTRAWAAGFTLVEQNSWDQFEPTGIEAALTSHKGVLGDSKLVGSIHPGTEPDCHMHGGCNGLFFRVSYQEPQRLAHVRDGATK